VHDQLPVQVDEGSGWQLEEQPLVPEHRPTPAPKSQAQLPQEHSKEQKKRRSLPQMRQPLVLLHQSAAALAESRGRAVWKAEASTSREAVASIAFEEDDLPSQGFHGP